MSDREMWSMVGGEVLDGVHPAEVCSAPCPLHSPSVHRMASWCLYWRDDSRLFERICPHGVGHPDPDDLAFKRSHGNPHYGVHGCDGCCFALDVTDGA
jgi:hypothetical protein